MCFYYELEDKKTKILTITVAAVSDEGRLADRNPILIGCHSAGLCKNEIYITFSKSK